MFADPAIRASLACTAPLGGVVVAITFCGQEQPRTVRQGDSLRELLFDS